MKKIYIIFICIFCSFVCFSNYWHPYPINVVIGINGSQQRLELSVWDSLLGSWQYYNTPYYNSNIDTNYSSSEIVVLKTYFTNIYDKDSIYGCITYDPVLHQFIPRLKANSDPDSPGADVSVLDNVVAIRTECCIYNGTIGDFFDISAQAYTYDINLHEWRGGEIQHGNAWDQSTVGMQLGIGGLLSFHYNDLDWNPAKGVKFYTPSLGIFGGAVGHDIVNGISGNQDQLYFVFQQFLDNNISSIRIYNPYTGYFPGFLRSEPGIDLMSEGLIYQSFPDSNLKYFARFDDFSGEMKIDTIEDSISIIRLKDRVGAYVDTSIVPTTVHYEVFSPTLHDWVKDSTISINGVVSLSITNGTVHWTDNLGIQYQAGYNDTTGWGNFDTPIQLMFQVTDMFPTMGIPLIFVRDYSIGVESAHFYFGDGYSTEDGQGSAWHQYKINGSYNSTANDTFNICIEAYTPFGPLISCRSISFATPLLGGSASASVNAICPGDSVLLVVTGYNGPIQWQYKLPGSTWQNDISATAVTDTLIAYPATNTMYRAKISNGTDAPAFSNIIQVDIIPFTTPTPIWGNSVVCNGMQTVFSVDSVSGILNYTWTIPTGWTGSSTTSSIAVTPNATGGIISVNANTSCGVSTPITKQVNVTQVDTSVSWDGDELWTNFFGTGATFSWIDCATGVTVSNWEMYEPTQNGSYACIVNYNGCIDTSSCWEIILTGIQNINSTNNVSVFPNPATENLTLTVSDISPGKYFIKLVDVYRQVVQQISVDVTGDHLKTQMDISSLNSGIYFLYFESDNYSRVSKVTKL